MFGAAGQHQRVEIFQQVAGRDVHADMRAAVKFNSFGFHLRHAPVDYALVQFEIRDAVA